ncbi:MAG: class I SAM-dependent methyltransferase [Acidimicrobiia bacterium]|nr:class I SAM-dependent methyltransferase [Acidimicrobiia bacterium]
MDGYLPETYGDAFVDVYDEWYGNVGDPFHAVPRLVELAGGGPVLELGVGTGRLAIPLVRHQPVWGVDASEAMLSRLAARPGGDAVVAVLGDMRDPAAVLPADRPAFAVVVVGFNTFFMLTSEGAQRDCLASVAGLLAPGGVFVVEAFVPGENLPKTTNRVVEPRTVALDHVVFNAVVHDPVEQVISHQLVEIRESGIKLRPSVLRYAWPAQLDEMAADAGLRLRERWAGWQGQPFDDDSTEHVSVYERA